MKNLLKAVENIDVDKYPVIRIKGSFRKRWYMRIVCLFKGHIRRRVNLYGYQYLQCERCGKEWFFKFKHAGKTHKWKRYYAGEIGELYQVKFSRKLKRKSY